jgi:hypothetical protein
VDTTDIEKKSLEAHVDLCALRYKHLETKLEAVEADVTEVKSIAQQTHELVHTMSEKRSDQIIGWGLGIIGALLAVLGWLVVEYILK